MFSQTIEEDTLNIKDGEQYLLFYLHSQLFAFDAKHVLEIVEIPTVTKVPWMHSSVRGICNIRGSVVGVIDIAKHIMDENSILTDRSSLVVVNIEYDDAFHKVGVIIDHVHEIEIFSDQELQQTPDFGLCVNSKYVSSVVSYMNEFIPVLDMDMILDIEQLSLREER
jgi:purine-binding chemotaxis protein CheW